MAEIKVNLSLCFPIAYQSVERVLHLGKSWRGRPKPWRQQHQYPPTGQRVRSVWNCLTIQRDCHVSMYSALNVFKQGRRHGVESGGDNFASGASKNFFLPPPHFLASGGDKILLRELSQPNSFVWFVADWHWCWYFLLLSLCFQH